MAGEAELISSRKSVPPSAARKRPGLSAIAPVNAPLTCPKSSLSKQRFRECPAAYFHERLIPPGRAMMNRPRQQRFSRSAFAGNQRRRPAIGDRIDQVENLQHLVIMPNDILQAEAQIELMLERLVFE